MLPSTEEYSRIIVQLSSQPTTTTNSLIVIIFLLITHRSTQIGPSKMSPFISNSLFITNIHSSPSLIIATTLSEDRCKLNHFLLHLFCYLNSGMSLLQLPTALTSTCKKQ